MSDRWAGGRSLAGLAPLWPTIRTVIADAGHESRKLARSCDTTGGGCEPSSANSEPSRSQVSRGLLSAVLHGSASTVVLRKTMSDTSRHQRQCCTSLLFA
jgi:hypothetical protein